MERPDWLVEQLDRARDPYTTPHALAIIRGLRGDRQPSQAVPDADPREVATAVQLLRRLELVRTHPADATEPHPRVTITTGGCQLAGLLLSEGDDDEDRILLTTPYAVEILFGIRDGVPPAQAVPPDAQPQEVVTAVELLKRLDLID